MARPGPALASIALGVTFLAPNAWAGGPALFGDGQSDWVRQWVIQDQVGNAVVFVNESGDVVQRRVFEPFGMVVQAPPPTEATPALFTGQPHLGAANLYDFGARWYDAEAGRFTSIDPIVQDPLRPETLNPYTYVGNNPVMFVDPDGRGFFDFLLKLLIAIVVLIIVAVVAPAIGAAVAGALEGLGAAASVVGTAVSSGISYGALEGGKALLGEVGGGNTLSFQSTGPSGNVETRAHAEASDADAPSQSDIGELLNQQYEILDEISELEGQLEELLGELRSVYEQFDRVTDPPRGDERAGELIGKAYASQFWLREIRKVRERADPILERLTELDRDLYRNRLRIVIRSANDYRVINEFSRNYPPRPDRFGEFNSRIEAIRRETLGSP